MAFGLRMVTSWVRKAEIYMFLFQHVKGDPIDMVAHWPTDLIIDARAEILGLDGLPTDECRLPPARRILRRGSGGGPGTGDGVTRVARAQAKCPATNRRPELSSGPAVRIHQPASPRCPFTQIRRSG